MHLTPPAEIDLGWWQSHYNDIIGYVYSPGTPISYPIAYDGDNDYYLHHDLYGNYSAYGTIFLDARANRDFTSQSNMLYGHHMADGTMFASISGRAPMPLPEACIWRSWATAGPEGNCSWRSGTGTPWASSMAACTAP